MEVIVKILKHDQNAQIHREENLGSEMRDSSVGF